MKKLFSKGISLLLAGIMAISMPVSALADDVNISDPSEVIEYQNEETDQNQEDLEVVEAEEASQEETSQEDSAAETSEEASAEETSQEDSEQVVEEESQEETSAAAANENAGEWQEWEAIDYSALSTSEENKILTSLEYEDGQIVAYYTPYNEDIYNEDTNPDAVGTITLSFYADNDANWEHCQNGTDYQDLIDSITVTDIQRGAYRETKTLAFDIPESVPEYYYFEAVYTLKDGENVILTEWVDSNERTEEVIYVSNLTVGDLKEFIEEDHIVNYNPEAGDASSDFAVLGSGLWVVHDEAQFTLSESSDGEYVYILNSLPEGILEAYPTDEALSQLAGLVFKTDNTDTEDMLIDNSDDGDYIYPIPFGHKAYRYIYGDGQDNDPTDAELTYYVSYVKDGEGNPTGIKFTVNVESGIADIYEYISYSASTATIDAAAFTNAMAQVAQGTYFDDISELLTGGTVPSNQTSYIDETNISGSVTIVPDIDFDVQFKIRWKWKVIPVGITLNLIIVISAVADYELTISGESHGISKEVVHQTLAAAYGQSISVDCKFVVASANGNGTISGRHIGKIRIKLGTCGLETSTSFQSEVLELKPEDDEELSCESSVGVDANLNSCVIDLKIFKIGPLAKGSFGLFFGHKVNGQMNHEEKAGMVHLCYTTDPQTGCLNLTTQKNYEGHISVTINVYFWKKTFAQPLFDGQDRPIKWYNSLTFKEMKQGDCPHWEQTDKVLNIIGDPEPGVYAYNAEGMDVALKFKQPSTRGVIYYSLDPDAEDEDYTEYSDKVHLDFEFDGSAEYVVREIYAYGATGKIDESTIVTYVDDEDDLTLDDADGANVVKRSRTETLTYIMMKNGTTVAIYPQELTLSVGEQAQVVCMYPAGNKISWTGDDSVFTFETAENDNLMSGMSQVTVTGKAIGSAGILKASVTDKDNKAVGEATCIVTVDDDLAMPTATYGTNVYFLRHLSISGEGDYKDGGYVDADYNAPYIYHRASDYTLKHTVAEVLTHCTWTTDEKKNDDIQIYYTLDGSTPTTDSFRLNKGEKVYLEYKEGSISELVDTGIGLETLKAIAYNPVTGASSDVATFYYIIVDHLPSAELGIAYTIMLPTEWRLSQFGIGICVAAYIPTITDLMIPENWIDVNPSWQKPDADPIPCFKISWHWSSSKWLTVPVLGTNEWITEPTIGVNFIQAGLVFGLQETGKENPVKVTARARPAISLNYEKTTKTGTCLVYVYDEDEPEEQTYTIKYDMNGGTGSIEDQTKKRHENIYLSETVPTRTSYTFKGWARTKSAASAEYQPGDIFTRDENLTLYAIWQKEAGKFVVHYDANGGEGAPADQSKEVGKAVTISSTKPTKKGAIFQGWSTSKTSTTVVYKPGDQYTTDADITLYAVWKNEENTFIITYDDNGGTGGPGRQVVDVSVTPDPRISSIIPKREGFEFSYWYDEKNHTMYGPNSKCTASENITLKAQWISTGYRIQYLAPGATNVPETQGFPAGKSVQISSQIPEKPGYKFKGWAKDDNPTAVVFTPGATFDGSSSLSLVGVFEPKVDVIAFIYDANGGEGAPDPVEIPRDASGPTNYTVSKQQPTRKGYNFMGWASSPTKTVVEYEPGKTYGFNKGQVKFYAIWRTDAQPNVLEVRNGTTVNGKNYEEVNAGTATGIRAYDYAEAQGKEFDRWIVKKGNISLTERQLTAEEVNFLMPNCDLYIEGNYVDIKAESYGLVVVNGTANGQRAAESDNVKYKEGAVVQAAADAITGKKFVGWTAEGINLTEVKTKAPVITFYMPKNNVKLVANYEDLPEEPHKVTVKNGVVAAEGEKPAATGDYKESTKLTVIADSVGGMVFDYWSASGITLSEAEKKQTKFEFEMPNQDVTLVAVYKSAEIAPHTINVDNGDVKAETEERAYGTGFYYAGTKLKVRAYSSGGFVFDHWDADGITLTQEQLESTELSIIMPDNDVLLVAVYTGQSETAHVVKAFNGTIQGPSDAKPKDSGAYWQGEEIVVQAAAAGGMIFDHWEASGIELTEEQAKASQFTFEMGSNDVTLAAFYTSSSITPHTINVDNGNVKGENESKAYSVAQYWAGAKLQVRAYTSGGFVFDHWEAKGVDLTEEELESPELDIWMPDNDVLLVAVYSGSSIESHIVTVKNGKVKAETEEEGVNTGRYWPGTQLSAKADPSGGMIFDHWVAAGIELTPEEKYQSEISFTMPEDDVALVAVYTSSEIVPYNVTVIKGTVKGDADQYPTDGGTYWPGSQLAISVMSTGGMVFDHWEADGYTLNDEEKTEPTLIIQMPENDVVFTAVYQSSPVEPHTLKIFKGNIMYGETSMQTEGTYYGGTNVWVTCFTTAGMVFDHWDTTGIELTDEEKVQAQLCITMPDCNATMTAVYMPISIDANYFGVVRGSFEYDGEKVTEGYFTGAVKLVVTADEQDGLVFSHWEVTKGSSKIQDITSDSPTAATITVYTPDEDTEITAMYIIKPVNSYHIKVVSGKLSDGKTEGDYYPGTKVIATADEVSGKEFVKWVVTIEPANAGDASGNASGSASGDASGNAPKSVSLDEAAVSLDEAFELTEKQLASKTIEFYMPDANITLKATYKDKKDPDPGPNPKPNPNPKPPTGESNKTILWVIIAIVSLGLVGSAVALIATGNRRKRKNSKK